MIGRTVGQYTFVDKLGEGGMGAVYRARDDRLDRDVAIKVLSIETEPELMIGDPEVLFESPYLMSRLRPQYDIGPGDSGFLMLTRPEDTWTGPIHVVFNWFEMLASR